VLQLDFHKVITTSPLQLFLDDTYWPILYCLLHGTLARTKQAMFQQIITIPSHEFFRSGDAASTLFAREGGQKSNSSFISSSGVS